MMSHLLHNRLQKYLQGRQESNDRQRALFEAGQHLGRHWLSKLATIEEAERLERVHDQLERAGLWGKWFQCKPGGGEFSLSERWHFAVIDRYRPGASLNPWARVSDRISSLMPNPSQARQFWRRTGATREQLLSGEFVRGFSEAALTAWQAIKAGFSQSN